MGHNGCDGSQASGPWAIGSGYRFIRVVNAVFVGGSGAHLLCSAQVNTGMKGMRCEWSAQRARRVRICAVLAMHVPN